MTTSLPYEIGTSPEAGKRKEELVEGLKATTDPLDDFSWTIVSPEELEQIHDFLMRRPAPTSVSGAP